MNGNKKYFKSNIALLNWRGSPKTTGAIKAAEAVMPMSAALLRKAQSLDFTDLALTQPAAVMTAEKRLVERTFDHTSHTVNSETTDPKRMRVMKTRAQFTVVVAIRAALMIPVFALNIKSKIKSNIVLILLAVLCCGIVSSSEALRAEAAADKIDVATYTGMSRLRKAVHLRNETLAAMGCGESDATKVLEALLGWYGSNKTAVEANRQASIQAGKALRLALRKIGMGPKNETLIASVPALKAALATATKQRNDLVKAAIAATEAQLSASQKGVWETARKNMALPSKYRYASSLTAAQAKALHVARRTYARRLAAAKGAAAKAAVTQQFNTAEGRILAGGQKTAMSAAQTNTATKMAGAIKASQTVTPMPAELVAALAADLVDPAMLKAAADKAAEK